MWSNNIFPAQIGNMIVHSTNCTPNLLFFMVKVSSSVQVKARLHSLREDSFSLPFTRVARQVQVPLGVAGLRSVGLLGVLVAVSRDVLMAVFITLFDLLKKNST